MKQIKKHYQNLIVGFGKGGKTLAAYLATHGQEVALIEKSSIMYGGSCINIACIPTKSLITNAEKNIPYREAIGIKDDLTSLLRQKNFENLDKHSGVTVITGTARFVSESEVNVVLSESKDEMILSADRIFINTGTQPFIPKIDGIETATNIFTSTTLMAQKRLPQKLIIIGGGFIGLEFADMYAKYGSSVTLLDSAERFLPKEDPDIADEIYKTITANNTRIFLGAAVTGLRNVSNGNVVVQFKNSHGEALEIEGSAVLIATGRKANLDGLEVSAAGLKLTTKGFLEVDDQLKTNVKNIWAIGDVNGGPQFTYISLDDFRIIRDQLFGGEYTSTNKRKAVASSVFITPSFAQIGLREKEAIENGHNIEVARLAAASVPRARILNNTKGILKSVVDSDSNKILGCSLFCFDAHEMINTIQVAINAGLDYRIIRDTIFTRPPMNEAFNDLYASI